MFVLVENPAAALDTSSKFFAQVEAGAVLTTVCLIYSFIIVKLMLAI